MDATSSIAARSASQTNFDAGSFFKPIFAMDFCTLVANLFVGRRWVLGRRNDDDHFGIGFGSNSDHRRYRDHQHRSADGYGHPS